MKFAIIALFNFAIFAFIATFSESFARAGSAYTPMPPGTIAAVRAKFDEAQKPTLADLKPFSRKLKCTSYDKNEQEEFALELTAELKVAKDFAKLNFESNPVKYTLIDQIAVMQSITTLLLEQIKMEIFLTARVAKDGSLMIKTAVYQTTPAKTEFLDGIIYSCQ